MIFNADFIACSTCFGHHYAHHQELESIIQIVAACGIWCFGFKVVGMVWSWELCVRFAGCCFKQQPANRTHLYNTLELLMMGIMVPETCWASNKICIKYHLLHLVGILLPHINDDARSESLQIDMGCLLTCNYIINNRITVHFNQEGANIAFAIISTVLHLELLFDTFCILWTLCMWDWYTNFTCIRFFELISP